MATRANAKPVEPEVEETEEEMEASPRYVLYSEWLQEEKGFEVDPLALEIAVKNYGEFQRSDVNREANQEARKANAEAREARKVAAAEKKAEAERKRQEAESKKAAAAEKPATKVTPAKTAAKKAAPARPAATKTVGKPRAARGKGAASPF